FVRWTTFTKRLSQRQTPFLVNNANSNRPTRVSLLSSDCHLRGHRIFFGTEWSGFLAATHKPRNSSFEVWPCSIRLRGWHLIFLNLKGPRVRGLSVLCLDPHMD